MVNPENQRWEDYWTIIVCVLLFTYIAYDDVMANIDFSNATFVFWFIVQIILIAIILKKL